MELFVWAVLSIISVLVTLYIVHLHKKIEQLSVAPPPSSPTFIIGEVTQPKKEDYDIIRSSPETVNAIIRILFYTVGLSMQSFQKVDATDSQIRVNQWYVNAYANVIQSLKQIIKVEKQQEETYTV